MSKQTRKAENSIVRDADPKAVKRAAWEAFEFAVEAPGLIRVSNGSYSDPENHSYIVNIENGVPVACECKAFQYGDGLCKHLVSIAIRQAVLLAAQSVAIPDGGQTAESCKNGQQGCCGPQGQQLPCFECYREADR